MDAQTLRDIQGYGAFIFLAVCAALLYGYYFHLYRSEKSGRRNYERKTPPLAEGVGCFHAFLC